MSRRLAVVNLGRIAYEEAQELQKKTALGRISGEQPDDVLFLLEHPPVITMGRTGHRDNVIAPTRALQTRGVDFFEIDRGGDVTFHGPGQLVGYLIYNLKEHREDLHWFLREVEAALIVSLGEHGIEARRNGGLTGVWVEDRKIASIGIHVKQWVTWHGFALNVNTDLANFDLIVPCGIQGVEMTSMQHETGRTEAADLWNRALQSTSEAFGKIFDQQVYSENLETLRARTNDFSLDESRPI